MIGTPSMLELGVNDEAIGAGMADDIRFQRKCYYASARYSASFWGKYVWLYQGKGSLRLTKAALFLEGRSRELEIPLHAIKSIGLGRFSTLSKPFGLSYLIVRYTQDGEPEVLHLVPYESALNPTWTTSKLVDSWHETLGRVETLANRVEPRPFDPGAGPSRRKVAGGLGIVVASALFGMVAGFGLLRWLMTNIAR
jgi:hypothetical protein